MIAVADGQCMLIVEQGKVVEVCAEPGEYTYDASTEPSIFAGNLGESIGEVFRNIGKRFTFGGEAPKDQRIYYFNTKELTGNKYGTPSPVPFRVVDQRAGIDIDIGIRCFGEYSYHIANPLLFYTNVCGNVTEDYTRDTLDGQLKSELLTALQPAFARISDMGIRYSALPGHTREIAAALNGMLYEGLPEAEGFAFIPPSIPGLGVTSGLSAVTQDLEGRGTAYLGEQTVRYLDSLRRRPEIATATTSFNAGVPQRRLVIDKAYAMQEGVELSDVYSAITTYLGGAYINNFNRFGKLYQTYLSAAPDYRTDRTSLDSYFVKNARNESVPVSAFVSVRDTVGPAYISQFNLYRSIALNIAPADGVSSKQAMEAVMEVAGEVLPADVDVAWSGTSLVESNESKSSSLVYLLSLAIVFLALAALYESWGLPAAILLGVPPAVLGAFVLLWFAHLFDSLFINDIYMQISLVMLIGLAAKNAILVVEYADRLFFEQKQSLVDAAVGAAKLRVRPILMTAFAFILGVMPLIFADGVYSTARNIMGVALVGGMLLATLLGIFIYPSLYYLIARLGRFERKRDLKSQNL